MRYITHYKNDILNPTQWRIHRKILIFDLSRDLSTDKEFKGRVSVSGTTKNDNTERTVIFH